MRRRRPVEDTWKAALDEAHINPDAPQPKCAGSPEEFSDYVTPPSRKESRVMCSGCPLLALCAQYGMETKQAWGVWGGLALVDGRSAARNWERADSAA